MRYPGIFYAFLLCLTLCVAITADAQKNLRVLFIGNSYTASHNLPNMIRQMALSAGDTLQYAISAPGGFTLEAHTSYAPTLDQIRIGGWDAVVLQEQSQRPSLTDSVLETHIKPYTARLDSLIRLYNPCARIIMYRTWGRQSGDAQHCGWWPPVCTYAGMDSLLALRYRLVALQTKAELAPVGDVWKAMREIEPSVNLYASDQSHPALAGTYAAAASFYVTLYRKPAVATGWIPNIPPSLAARIRHVTDAVVYQHPEQWYHGKYDLTASMQVDFLNSYTIRVQSLSQEAAVFSWDFGQGVLKEGQTVTHEYGQSGSNTIRHWVRNGCGISDTIQRVIEVYIPERTVQEPLLIYPNPSGEQCKVYGTTLEKVICIDALGRVSEIFPLQGLPPYTLNLRHIAPGFYRLMLIGKTNTWVQSLIRR